MAVNQLNKQSSVLSTSKPRNNGHRPSGAKRAVSSHQNKVGPSPKMHAVRAVQPHQEVSLIKEAALAALIQISAPLSTEDTDLPFIKSRGKGKGVDFWSVTSTGDHARDSILGTLYAIRYLQWLRNGGMSYTLWIIEAQAAKKDVTERAIRINFWSCITDVLRGSLQSIDLIATAENIIRKDATIHAMVLGKSSAEKIREACRKGEWLI